jgi:hypothetical protein
MKIVHVEITGKTALLMHRFGEAVQESGATRRIEKQQEDPREAAEKVAYRKPDKTLYIPGSFILGTLAGAGANHKSKGSRRSLRFILPQCVTLAEECIPLYNGNGKPATDYEVYSVPVVIRATQGRIMRHRPRLNTWSAKFDLTVNEDIMATKMVHQLLEEAGLQVGIGDWRPARGGVFGTFLVSKWQEA